MAVAYSVLFLFFAAVGVFDTVRFCIKKYKEVSQAKKKSKGVSASASTDEQSIGL